LEKEKKKKGHGNECAHQEWVWYPNTINEEKKKHLPQKTNAKSGNQIILVKKIARVLLRENWCKIAREIKNGK